MLNRFGRKNTIIGSSVAVILASAILTCAQSYNLLLLGCFLKGSAVGVVRPAVGLYISEIAPVQYRGTLGSLNALTPNAGYLYAILVGTNFPLKYFPRIMVLPSLVFIMFSWALVDTPLWFIKVGRREAARRSIKYLRGKDYNPEPELQELETLLWCKQKNIGQLDSLYQRRFLLPTFILCGLFFIYAASGIDTFSYYGLTLFQFPDVSLSPATIAVFFQVKTLLQPSTQPQPNSTELRLT